MIRQRGPIIGLIALLPLMMLGSLAIGPYPVRVATIARMLAPASDATPIVRIVVEVIRLPRVACATLAGIGLGLGGAALQGVFRNPLVGPDIVGVSAGAACGGVLAIAMAWDPVGLVASAFAGGLASLAAAAALARLAGGGILGIVLAGILVGGFCSALLGLIEFLVDPDTTLPAIVFWLMGSFAGADRDKLLILIVTAAIGGGGLLLLRWRINLLSLGDEDAAGLGVAVAPLRWTVVALVALLVAGQVAVSGIVGWVGLLVPHAARALVGPDHRRLLPVAGLLGGAFTLGIDDLARTVAAQELPIGLLTALIGTPAFAFVFHRTSRSGWRTP